MCTFSAYVAFHTKHLRWNVFCSVSVFKYKRDSDQSFAMKIAKLNFHSIKKKSSRMRGRLTTNLGIGLQVHLCPVCLSVHLSVGGRRSVSCLISLTLCVISYSSVAVEDVTWIEVSFCNSLQLLRGLMVDVICYYTYYRKLLQRIRRIRQLNQIALRSHIGRTQQIKCNCPRDKRCRQNIETGRREKKKKQTLKIESWTQTWEETYTNTLTVNKDTNNKGIKTHQYTSIHTVLLLFR